MPAAPASCAIKTLLSWSVSVSVCAHRQRCCCLGRHAALSAFLPAVPRRSRFSTGRLQAPGFGERRKALLQDIAIVTGAEFVAKDLGMKASSDLVVGFESNPALLAGSDSRVLLSFVDAAGQSFGKAG